MNKQYFISAIRNLEYKKDNSSTYAERMAYAECKDDVIRLAERLDDNGLSFEGYQLLRSQTDELVKVYKELGDVNNELFNSYKQNRELMKANNCLQENAKDISSNEIKSFQVILVMS